MRLLTGEAAVKGVWQPRDDIVGGSSQDGDARGR
jgi:hypothetical protein